MFIEGKVKLFGTEKKNSNKRCTKMFYTESKSINTFDISENIFPLTLLLFRWMFFMSRIEILLFCNKVTVIFLWHVLESHFSTMQIYIVAINFPSSDSETTRDIVKYMRDAVFVKLHKYRSNTNVSPGKNLWYILPLKWINVHSDI